MSGPTEAEAGLLALVRAGRDDLPGLAALANRAYRSGGGWTAESGLIEGDRISVGLLEADLAAQPDAMLLVHHGSATDAPLACVRIEPAGAGVWHLGLLAVAPEQQGSGLGQRTLAAAEARVRRRGGRRIRISVINLRDSLIAWYERRGYRRTGETQPFPYGDERFGRPLRQDMSFVALEKVLMADTRAEEDVGDASARIR